MYIITYIKEGILSGCLTLKNGLISGILLLKNILIMVLSKTMDFFKNSIITAMCICRTLITVQNLIGGFFAATGKWLKARIMDPIQSAYHAVMQFLKYWLCGHWWPDLESWLALHVIFRLQLLFNYFCFGMVYVICGYWLDPFIASLSRHFSCFYAYFQQSILNPIKM